jgi:hypothetical protein
MHRAGEYDLSAVALEVYVRPEFSVGAADGIRAADVRVEGSRPAGYGFDGGRQAEGLQVRARIDVHRYDAAGPSGTKPHVAVRRPSQGFFQALAGRLLPALEHRDLSIEGGKGPAQLIAVLDVAAEITRWGFADDHHRAALLPRFRCQTTNALTKRVRLSRSGSNDKKGNPS